MNTMKMCSGCQKALPECAPDGLCPECLLKAGLGTGVDVGPDSEGGSGQTAFVAPSVEEVARLFPQLEMLGFIGQGGMGAVYKGRQKALERIVALKILPPGIGKDPAFAERFTREAKALARLNHPGVVTIYEFGQADGLFFFLMEFVDGMSLRHLLEVERISAREALAIVPQICDALQYAHDQGIVHRDIKPENILLDRQGRAKVADFGLAKLVGTEALTPALSHPMGEGGASAPGEGTSSPAALTDAGKVMGTPQYMAPEQREHPTEVDHRADIYSLGVVFYQMLTGELPGKPIEAPSRKVQVDVRLDEVVLRALEKEPARRYQQVSEVRTAVESISRFSSPVTGAAPSPGRPAAARGRLRAALIAGVLVWLFVTGIVTLITWIRPQSWKVVAVISCPLKSQPGRPMGEHFKHTAAMIEIIRSDVILGRVIDRLQLDERSGKLDERWGKRNLGLNLTKPQAMVLMKRRLDVRSEGGTLIQVGVFGKRPEEPEEAMDIANTIAEELRAFRIEQHDPPADMLEMTLLYTAPDILLGIAAGLVLGLLAGRLVLWRGFSRRGSQATAVPLPGNPPRPRTLWPWVVAAVAMVLLIPVVVIVVTRLARESREAESVRREWRKTEAVRREVQGVERARSTAEQGGLAPLQSPNRVLEVRCEGPKAYIQAELDDLHELHLFIGSDAQGWSSQHMGSTSVRATVEASSQIKMEDDSMGRGLIFQAWGARHYIAITPGGPVPYGEVVFRPNSGIAKENGTFTFADIRQTNGTLVPVCIRIRPGSGRSPGRQSFGPVIECVIATPEADEQGLVFFDLETGTSLKPPFALTFHPNQGPAFVELTPELKQWIKARDVDILLYLGEKNWDMMTLEMQERFAGQASEWETISLETVIDVFSKREAEHVVLGHSYAHRFDSFNAFRTRSNTLGVYQFEGVDNSTTRGVRLRYRLVLEAGESAQSTGGERPSRTFVLRHRLASEMANVLGQILLGRVGMEARPAANNVRLTVTAPSDVLNRVSTFVAVTDWPKRIAQGKDYYYPREDTEQAGRSFFYACSIEDIEGVTRMLAPGVLAELKGTNLTAQGVGGEEKDEELVRQLRGNWEGKEAAVRRVVLAWNRFPLRTLQVEGKFSMSPGPRYFASAAFEGAPVEWVELSFVPDRSPKTKREPHFGPVGPRLMDTLPPWFGEKESGPKKARAAREKAAAELSRESVGAVSGCVGERLPPTADDDVQPTPRAHLTNSRATRKGKDTIKMAVFPIAMSRCS